MATCELEQPTRTLGWRTDGGNRCGIISTVTPRKRVVPATLPCAEVPVAAAVKSYSSLHLRDQGKRRSRASLCSRSSDRSRLDTKTDSKLDLQEKDTEIEVGEVFWNTRIVPILRELEKEENIETVCAACTQLHHALEEGNMLGSKFKRRSILLKTLYKLVDVDSDLLSLKLAKIILALKVSGKNLLSVCKLIFKISRSEKNDSLIKNDGILGEYYSALPLSKCCT
eukprot:bmy_05558T0